MPISNPASFYDEARFQGECAVLKTAAPWEAHHCLYRQELRRLGLPEWDTRNALRVSVTAHARHHNRQRPIRTAELTDSNLAYFFEVLGERAVEYLRARYDEMGADPRIEDLYAALPSADREVSREVHQRGAR